MLLTLLAFFAAAAEPLATVNGQAVTQADVDTLLEQIPADQRAGYAAETSLLVEQLIASRLLAADAQRQGLQDTEHGKQVIAIATEQALVQLALDAALSARITDARVQAWYDEHKEAFSNPEARARHILVDSQAEAAAILAQLKSGGDFAAIAKAKSNDPSAQSNGGELGWFSQDRMVEEFATAVFGAKKGDLLGPVQTQFGWHVIEVEDRRDATPLADVADQIREELRDEVVQDYIRELKDGAKITRSAAMVATLLEPVEKGPDLPADAPRYGAAKAQVTMVVFSDMQCPFCAKAHEDIERMLPTRADLAVVYRHYPLDASCNPGVQQTRHAYACEAAKAVQCVGDQGDELISALLGQYDSLDSAKIHDLALATGAKAKKLDACMADAKTTARIQLDTAAGDTLGVDGTPTVFLGANGKWWKYAGQWEMLGAAIDHVKSGG